MSQANGPAATVCPVCQRYEEPRVGRSAAFCAHCGGPTTRPHRLQLDVDFTCRRYLLDVLTAWAGDGRLDDDTRARLAAPYEADLRAITQQIVRDHAEPLAADEHRPTPPHCHTQTRAGERFCADCGAAIAVQGELFAPPVAEIAAPPPLPAAEAPIPAVEIAAPSPPLAAMVADARAAIAAIAEPVPAPERPHRARRLLRELRPVFYENLILFLGAFLVFAGSIYFAVYFWDRLGAFGPLVAGGLLALYGLGFTGTGYLLQRRYHADLSARVLYGVATAMLPVAATLLGEPLRAGSAGTRVLAGGAVAVLCAIAYPAIVTAASLFQREIGVPFARSFVALLAVIGVAPVVGATQSHALGVAYMYLATLPVLAMYRKVRDVGLVFERATVVYIVGGSAYLIAAEAVRVALATRSGIAAAEIAPLGVLFATAAIDLDVAWRQRAHATRSALGVVGVLAHAIAIVAIAVAASDPAWRVVTTLSAGLVFAVTALRHRRPPALYLAIATTAAGSWLIVWLPALAPPHGAALGGLILLPIALGLARLAARWRRHAAPEFARPCEHGVLAIAIFAALGTSLPLVGDDWTIAALGDFGPALIVLPAVAAVLALAWAWDRQRPYLAGAALALAAAVLVAASAAGATPIGLALIAAALTIALAGAASRSRAGAPALTDAALAVLATTIALLAVGRAGPWLATSAAIGAACFVALAAATVAVATQRPYRALGVIAVISLGLAGAAALWPILAVTLIPIVLALALLAVDRTLAGAALGPARPFRDAYALAIGLVALQVITTAATADSLATISPLAAGLIALALVWIAARHASPWPTYGAIACLAGAGYAAPAALGLALPPRAVASGVGLVIIVLALVARAAPRLRRWRESFLDVPLHVAAVIAPINLLRVLWLFAAWEADGAPTNHVVLRRLASPLGLAVLAAITHGSRLHAYVAAAASVLILPAVVAFLGLGDHAIAPALAGAAILCWLASAAIARRPVFARPVARDDLPLPLFGHWPVPSAATQRDLWRPPVIHLGLIAAVGGLGLAVAQTAVAWPTGSVTSAVAYALLTAYAIAHARGHRIAVHAACATIALLAGEVAHVGGASPGADGLVILAGAYVIASEILQRRAVLAWAIGFSILPVTAFADLAHPTTPIAAAVLAAALVRLAMRYPARGLRTVASIAITATAGFAVVWIVPDAFTLAALAATASLAAWAHWLVRGPTGLGAPFPLVSAWATIGGVLAMIACGDGSPATAPIVLALAALALTAAWFGFAAVRTGALSHGYVAEATLVALYVAIRISPVGDRAGLTAETDLVVAIGAAFVLHFASILLARAQLPALARPAIFGARLLPIAACLAALELAAASDHPRATIEHAVLAETIGALYLLDFRRGGPRALGAIAIGFANLGLALLWIHTDRRDPLFYTVPLGVSISLCARLYQAHLSRSARRGLRAAGALLIYFSTYFQVVQFDHGLYPLLLGGFTLVGIALGFWLQLRELFTLSVGFLVLDVISNLAYYGVHRPVLGWTLLTLAGLCLTASGVVFQLRRAQVRGLVSDVRTTLARWD
jgi:hypothetical protein